jgi:hypothetical protein
MTRRTIAAIGALELIVLLVLSFALLDRRAHLKSGNDGVNQWGYRGVARAERQEGEVRVALIGGSAAYEYGVPNAATLAGRLFIELRAAARRGEAYSVVNLSEPQLGADSYEDALRRYRYLEPDVVCVFDGYDGASGTPQHGRMRSLAFRLAGYLPVLPSQWFGRPPYLSDPDRGVAPLLRDGAAGDVTCAGASRAYCGRMVETVRDNLAAGAAVIVVTPPAPSTRFIEQQRSLADELLRTFGSDERFAYLDVSTSVPVRDHDISPDGLHRTDAGNHEIARRIVPIVVAHRSRLTRAVDAGVSPPPPSRARSTPQS